MPAVPASLYLRVRTDEGGWTYARSVSSSNGRLRPLYALIDGKPVHCPDGVYHLRFAEGGKRKWQAVGTDSTVAHTALQRKIWELQGRALDRPTPATPGPIASEATVPSPPVIAESEPVLRRLLTVCTEKYLEEIAAHKAKRTLATYRTTLKLFRKVHSSGYALEDITRENPPQDAQDVRVCAA